MGRERKINDIMINDYKILKKNLIINDYNDYNDYRNTKKNRKGFTPQLARNKADYLCNKLESPQSRYFYLKCAWNLTDSYINYLLGIALTKDSPAQYFSAVASRVMKSNQ